MNRGDYRCKAIESRDEGYGSLGGRNDGPDFLYLARGTISKLKKLALHRVRRVEFVSSASSKNLLLRTGFPQDFGNCLMASLLRRRKGVLIYSALSIHTGT